MVSDTYSPPVDKLLTYADCNKLQELSNYIEEFGFGKEHIPDLIRMATDKSLHDAEPDSLEVWAPLHACCTLGQLRATQAIEPMINLFHGVYASWSYFDLPKVFGLIGVEAIPALTKYLTDNSREVHQRFAAASSLVSIAENYPDTRNKCVSILTQQLELFAVNDSELNAVLINQLIDLNAVESVSVIEKAFAARKVDTMITGDWANIQVKLGLKTWEDVYSFDDQPETFTTMFNYSVPKLFSPKAQGFSNASSQKKRKKKKK